MRITLLPIFASFMSLFAVPARAQLAVQQWTGEPESMMGAAFADVGDLDGDGGSEYLVAEPGYDQPNFDTGRVRIYQGVTRLVLREHVGTQIAELFGASAAGVGDLDGDGIPDYAIGSTSYDGLTADVGRVVVYSGATGAELWNLEGNSPFLNFSVPLAAIDDMDGDGRGELLVGVQYAEEVWVVDSNGAVDHVLTPATNSRFGASLARVGDLDLDGKRDFLIGAPGHTSGGKVGRGRVIAYSGADASQLYDVLGADRNDEYGTACAFLGDVNVDGWDDYVVGAAGANPAGPSSGLVQVLSGKDGALIGEMKGTTVFQRLGQALAYVGDWDKDGTNDFAAGAPGGADGRGEVLVISGATLLELWGVDGLLGPLFNGPGYIGPSFFNSDLGAVLTTGDFDGNGEQDLLIGDPLFLGIFEIDPPYYSNGWFLPYYPPGSFWGMFQLGAAYLFTGHPAYWENYGAGWPGQNGIPSLTALVDPVLGETLDVFVTSSFSATTAALFVVGFAAADIPTSAGGRLLVDPFWTFALPLPASGMMVSAELPGLLLDLYVQVLEADPFASDGISFTPGLHLRTGFGL